MFFQDMCERLSLANQRTYQLIQCNELLLRQIDPLAGLSQLFPILPVCMIRIVKVLIEKSACRSRTSFADIRSLSFYLAGVVHKIRASAVAGCTLAAWDPALVDTLFPTDVPFPAGVSVLASVGNVSLAVLFLIIPVPPDLFRNCVCRAPDNQGDLCKCSMFTQSSLDLMSFFPGEMFSLLSLFFWHRSSLSAGEYSAIISYFSANLTSDFLWPIRISKFN